MSLSTGTRLGPYEITTPLGAGGMGEVYRARDTRLDRIVAIKILPAETAARPDVRQRFEREARAVSSLNHPHICTLHDIGQQDGIDYLVMEYLEGETLAERLKKGPLPLKQALRIATEVAGALERAHRSGITHRDLKPGNIMLTKDGAKVLDFGLAKMTAVAQTTEAGATLTIPAFVTAQHTVMGTPYYMAPEQVQGQEADSRADIFAFGCVLYEMLSGRRPFDGKSSAGVMAAVLEKDPEPLASSVAGPATTRLDWLIRRCLEKDADARFQNIHDVRLELDNDAALPESASTSERRNRREWMAWLVTGLCLVALGGAIWKLRRPGPRPGLQLARLTWDAGVSAWPAISPDGKLLAYASDRDGQDNLDLYVQQIPGGRPVRITQTSEDETEPSFSPDGASIAFTKAGDSIYVVPALGGEPRLLARGGHTPRFSPDGNWVAYWSGLITSGNPTAEGSGRIYVISTSGGTPRPIHPEFPMARWPVWSPDGRSLIFQGVAPGPGSHAWERLDYWVTPLEGGAVKSSGLAARLRKAKLPGLLFNLTCWTSEGLFFNPPLGEDVSWGGMQKNIYRATLDKNGTAGDVVQVTAGTAQDVDAAIARNGRMVFASGGQRLNVWGVPIDGNSGKVRGKPYRITEGVAPTIHPDLSPDGKKLLFDSQRNGYSEVWMRDLATGKEVVVATSPGGAGGGFFLPSSGRIRYWTLKGNYVLDLVSGESRKIEMGAGAFDRTEQIALVRHDTPNAAWDALDMKSGKRTRLLQAEHWSIYLTHFTPDGRWIIFLGRPNPTDSRIYVARWHGLQEIPQSEWLPVTDGKGVVDKPLFSPDGRMIYFTSDQAGSRSIHAIRFDPESGRPIGEPFLVYDFRGPRLSMLPVNLSDLMLGVAQDKIVMVLAESNWNVFTAVLGTEP